MLLLNKVNKDANYVANDIEKRRGKISVADDAEIAQRYSSAKSQIEKCESMMSEWKVRT